MSNKRWWFGLIAIGLISFWQWKATIVVLLYAIFTELVKLNFAPTNDKDKT